MFKTDRENYEKYWDSISPFIKFGCLKDEKFGEKMKDSMLYKNLDHKYMTLEEVIKENAPDAEETEETQDKDAASAEGQSEGNDGKDGSDQDAADASSDAQSDEKKEEEKTSIYYVTDEIQQSQYINMFKAQGQDAIILSHNIDAAFITYLEEKHSDIQSVSYTHL